MPRRAIEQAITNHDEHAILGLASKAIEATGRAIHGTVAETLAKTRAAAGHDSATRLVDQLKVPKKKRVASADSTNTGKALALIARLPRLSDADADFRAIPIPQGRDVDVKALEKVVMPAHTMVDYNPATTHPLATQDYVEASRLMDIVKQSTAGGQVTLPEHEPVRVARFRGRDYIVDGHHRLTAALMTGDTVKAKYYRVK